MEKEIIIYINKKKFINKNLSLIKNLEQLRIDLEKEIPNNIKFENDGKLLEQKEEKIFNISNILYNSNIINLSQDYFKIIIDDIVFKKKVDFFKNDSFQKIIEIYKNELPKCFMIKCESNLLIQINNYKFDDNLIINDVLKENSIFIFSLKKIKEFASKNDSMNLFIKKNGNISFGNIKSKEIKKIIDSLELNEKFISKESNYEIRRKESLKEYEIYKN